MVRLSVVVLLTVAVLGSNLATAKVFSQCTLAKELLKHHFPRTLLSNWVCLVESESGRNTTAVAGPQKDGSYNYGLFQINSKLWCKSNFRGGDCNATCRDLQKDDISTAASCAKKIFQRSGFNAWDGWKTKCKGKTLPNLRNCL